MKIGQSEMKQLIDQKYITATEMLKSNTAEKLGIRNVPEDDEIIDNINYTIERLNDIRERYNKKIIITSGYRCTALNKAVGGKPTSQHVKGQAADLKYDPELLQFIIDNYHYDQLIEETSKRSKWIHISFKRENERNQYIKLSV